MFINMLKINSINKCLKYIIQPKVSQYFCTALNKEENTNDQNKNCIVWIDMETTGTNINSCRILEVACLVTDDTLNIISDKFEMVLHQSDNELSKLISEKYNKFNLIELSKESTYNEKTVDENLLYFLMKYVPKGKCPLAGKNANINRLFLRKYMPTANDYMHYRVIDLSSVTELMKRWKPDIYNEIPVLETKYSTIDNIKENIQVLKFYRKNVFSSCK